MIIDVGRAYTDTFRDRLLSKVKIPHEPGGCWLWVAAQDQHGYGRIQRGRKGAGLVKAHRAVYELYFGPIPDGLQLDHTCHVRQCVNPEHLRPVTPKQNAENRGAQVNNRSGVRGVSWHARAGKWRATVTHNRVQHHAGLFDTVEAAAEAARLLRLRLFTHSQEGL